MSQNNALFTYELFLKLKQISVDYSNTDQYNWFKMSYKAFANYPINTPDDVIRVIAFAYSWMPTMAKFKSEFENKVEIVIQALNDLKNITDLKGFEIYEIKLKEVLVILVKIINNSIVGTSKVLHFTNPAIFPIIDSRVIKGWNKLMESCDRPHTQEMIPTNKLSDPNRAPAFYIDYSKNMLNWLFEINKYESDITIRDLEVYLYLIGK